MTNEEVLNKIRDTIGVHDDLHGEDAQLRWNGQVSRSPGMSATIPQETAKEKEEEEERRNDGKTI